MFAVTCEDPPPLTNRKPVYITGSTGFPVQWCELLFRCIISEGLLLTHLLMEKFLFYHRTFPHAVTVHTEGEYLGVYFTMEGECADSLSAWHGNADEPSSRLQTAASISDFILISRSQDAAHSSPSSRLAAMTLTKTHFIVWNFVNFHRCSVSELTEMKTRQNRRALIWQESDVWKAFCHILAHLLQSFDFTSVAWTSLKLNETGVRNEFFTDGNLLLW